MSWIQNMAHTLHHWAAAEVEARFPTRRRSEDPPRHAGRTQLIGLAVFLIAPVAIWLLLDWLTGR
ncbi:MAG: hypothetical protein QMD96_05150 [Anaerosomatales bacterium]|nr:hypothetical protein [Anaerosomatales bacterium]